MVRIPVLLMALALVTAGCIGIQDPITDDDAEHVTASALETPDAEIIDLDVDASPPMTFTDVVVDAAVGHAFDLYEPTMEVSDTGVIYVTGHTIAAATTGAPVFMSHDDGQSWKQLPFAASATMPGGLHSATPPPSAEIFLTAGDDGRLWGVDVTLATYPVNGWCGDGAEHCYHNPNAYDEVQSAVARTEAVRGEDSSCSPFNINDRPWASYANGKLLMVNNPNGGPVQVGVMDVPPAQPVGGPGIGGPGPVSTQWNLCAGEGGGSIPGIADMRDDHFFAVPQVQDGKLVLVKGNAADVTAVEQMTLFRNTNTGGGTSNYGQVVFDAQGTMFVGIRNNTQKLGDGERRGQLHVAVSTDDGQSFTDRTIRVGTPTTSIYMDGNMNGAGALLTWAQDGDSKTDWYAAHLRLGPSGEPVVENVSLVLDEGPPPSAHVQGAAAGPDGRAYLVMFNGGYAATDRATPLEVWVQQEGPTLPVAGQPS